MSWSPVGHQLVTGLKPTAGTACSHSGDQVTNYSSYKRFLESVYRRHRYIVDIARLKNSLGKKLVTRSPDGTKNAAGRTSRGLWLVTNSGDQLKKMAKTSLKRLLDTGVSGWDCQQINQGDSMNDAAIRRGTNAYKTLKRYALGEEQDCVAFSQMLLGFITAELWKSGWVEESSGAFLKAESLEDFITNRRYLDTTIPWIYSRLELAAPLDTSKDKLIAAAQAAFTQAIKDETGKSPKEWYEEQLAKALTKTAQAQTDENSEEYVKRGPKPSGEMFGSTKQLSEEANAKPYILRRLARERPDLLERYERGELSANAAAIEAGFRKRPTPFEIVKAQIPKLSDAEWQALIAMRWSKCGPSPWP